MSVEFLITTLIIVAIPGTGVIYTLAASPSRGRRAGLIAAVGYTLRDCSTHRRGNHQARGTVADGCSGVSGFEGSGGLSLLYRAWVTLKEKDALVVKGETAPDHRRRSSFPAF